MLKKLAIALVAIVLLIILGAFLLPSKVHVERSISMEAPASTVFALTNGFIGFNRWSPWFDRDPQAEYKYEGPISGVGAKMSWKSENPKVGIGSQEVTAVEPNKRVDVRLDFGDEGTADTSFTIESQGNQTKVTWGFETDLGMNPIARYMGTMLDKWVGGDYEKGLDKLKTLAESLPKVDISDLNPEVLDLKPVRIAYVSTQSTTEPEALGTAMSTAFGKVMAFMKERKITPAGLPLSLDTNFGADEYVFDAGIPISSEPESLDENSEVKIGDTPAGKTLHFVHKGSYKNLSAVHETIQAYLTIYGLEMSDRSWAQYTSNPKTTAEEDLQTQLYFPIK